MVGRVRIRRLLAGLLMLFWLWPAAALARSDSEDPSAGEEPAPSTAEQWQRVGELTFDLLLLRPAAVGGAVVGFGFFMVSMPFVVFTDRLDETHELFMGIPGEYAFQRAIGEI